jgi:hypothetical protein
MEAEWGCPNSTTRAQALAELKKRQEFFRRKELCDIDSEYIADWRRGYPQVIAKLTEDVISTLGKKAVKCNKQGRFLNCTCPTGLYENTAENTCEPCRNRARKNRLSSYYEIDYDCKELITTAKIVGPVYCRCAYCDYNTESWSEKTYRLPLFDTKHYPCYGTLQEKCTPCVIKYTLEKMDGRLF